MKKNLIPLLAIAFVVAIACTAVFYGLVAGKLAGGVEANATRSVVIATRDLPSGAKISAGDVKDVSWTASEPPPGSYSTVSQVVGMTAINTIAANEPLTDAQAMSAATGGSLGIPSGMRAISVQVSDSSGVLAMLKPGHRVDVQAVYTRSGSSVDAELRTVLQNVQVLRVNPQPEPMPGKPTLPVVTLLTTPAQADVAGLADAVARVRLVLRNPLDRELTSSQGVAIVSVMHPTPSYSFPAPRTVVSAAPQPSPASKLTLQSSGAACNPATGGTITPLTPAGK